MSDDGARAHDPNAPWLSVIIPAQNGEAWIETCLLSLVAEEAPGIEVLLIDGGPGRHTVELASTFAGRLTLRIFERPDLTSWHTKTNFGVAAANAFHLCWLGVDDVWLPGRAAAVRAWIDAAPRASLHLAASAIIDAAGRSLGFWRCPLPIGQSLVPSMVLARLLVQNFVAAPAPVFRKDAWQRCGGLNEALWYTADWDMWLKLGAEGDVYYHDEVTVGFRIHGATLTMSGSRNPAVFAEQMRCVLDQHLPALQGRRGDRRAVERAARASIEVNCALAMAAAGNFRALPGAVLSVLGLGPAGIHRYVRDSRILDRLGPRIRAKLSGRL